MIVYLNADVADVFRVSVAGEIRAAVSVDEATADKLKTAGLVDWMDSDGIDKLPADWKGNDGQPLFSVFGHEPRPVVTAAEPAEVIP